MSITTIDSILAASAARKFAPTADAVRATQIKVAAQNERILAGARHHNELIKSNLSIKDVFGYDPRRSVGSR